MTSDKKILIVDDVPDNIRVLAKHFAEDYQILAATSGADALAIAGAQEVDLVLLDVQMPDMDGYDVLSHLQGSPLTCDIPVIFVTSDNSAESETAALQSGASDFVNKPVNPRLLQTRVSAQLELASQRKALRDSNRRLEEKVTARTVELLAAKDAAEAASRAKTLFIGNMSHEMRTPLHQIAGIAGMFKRDARTEKQVRWAEMLEHSTQRLDAVIGGILTLVDIESGSAEVSLGPVNVGELVGGVLSLSAVRAEEKGLQLKSEIDDLPDGLLGDSKHLSTILRCYVNNAIAFSDRGEITVRVSKNREDSGSVNVRIEVQPG